MEKLELPLDDLVLDLANPRLGEVGTQAEALKALIDLGPAYFRTMMASIRDNGLDPGDAFYVIEDGADDKAFIVLDGNRRLAALRVLNEPSVLRGIGLSEGEIKSIAVEVKGYQAGTISGVDCVLFPDRPAADEWIERRHGKDLGGEGRLTWGPLEIERFQRDHSNLDVISFVERNTLQDGHSFAPIKAAVEGNSTTLNRFLSSKALRKLIGLTITTETDDSRVPYFTSTPEDALRILERIFADIHDKKINSRSHNTADEIEAYLQEIAPKGVPSAAKPGASVRFRDAVTQNVKALANPNAAATTKPEKTTRAQRPRTQLAEKRHLFEQPATVKGRRLVMEASKLNAQEFTLAAAYILRAFLEQTVDTYMERHHMPRAEGNGRTFELHKRAEMVIDHLIKNGATGQALRGAKRILTDTKNATSIQALNDYHHDRYQVPAADVVRTAWDACVPLFVAVYGAAS